MKKSFFGNFNLFSKISFVIGCVLLAGSFIVLVIGPFLPAGSDASPLAVMLLIPGLITVGMAVAVYKIYAFEEFGCWSWLSFLMGCAFIFCGLMFLLLVPTLELEGESMAAPGWFLLSFGAVSIAVAFIGKHWRVR